MRDTRETTYRLALLALCLVAAAARLPGISAPLADHNLIRQSDTAAIARGLHRSGFDILHPDYLGGGPGPHSVESEFPLYAALVAAGYRLAGAQEWVGRMASLLLSTLCVPVVAALGRRFSGRAAAIAAASIVAVSPLGVSMGRAFQGDGTVVLLTGIALLAMTRWADRESGGLVWLLLSGAAASLAVLAKLPALLACVPLAIVASRRAAARSPATWLFVLGTLVPPFLWYWHAHGIYLREGFTYVHLLPGTPGDNKWTSLGSLLDPRMWAAILFVHPGALLLTPLGFVLFLRGLLGRDRQGDLSPLALRLWAWTLLLFAVATLRAHAVHDYYALPWILPGALLAGCAAASLLGSPRPAPAGGRPRGWAVLPGLLGLHLLLAFGAWAQVELRRGGSPFGPSVWLLAAALLLPPLGWIARGWSARAWARLRNLRPAPFLLLLLLCMAGWSAAWLPLSGVYAQDRAALEAAAALERITEPGEEVMTAGPGKVLLYLADRRGWATHREPYPATALDYGARHGAVAYAATRAGEAVRDPEAAAWLEANARPAAWGDGWAVWRFLPRKAHPTKEPVP